MAAWGDSRNRECPGESNCERFLTSVGATETEKAANACTGCELLPTKPSASPERDDAWMLAAVERMRRERDSGGGIDLTTMNAAEWQLIQLWDQLEAQYERRITRELHDAMLILLHDAN